MRFHLCLLPTNMTRSIKAAATSYVVCAVVKNIKHTDQYFSAKRAIIKPPTNLDVYTTIQFIPIAKKLFIFCRALWWYSYAPKMLIIYSDLLILLDRKKSPNLFSILPCIIKARFIKKILISFVTNIYTHGLESFVANSEKTVSGAFFPLVNLGLISVSAHMYTVRKNDIILRSIERMLQTQLSMARKFPLWRLRRYSIKFSKLRNFTFNAPWPEETNNTG